MRTRRLSSSRRCLPSCRSCHPYPRHCSLRRWCPSAGRAARGVATSHQGHAEGRGEKQGCMRALYLGMRWSPRVVMAGRACCASNVIPQARRFFRSKGHILAVSHEAETTSAVLAVNVRQVEAHVRARLSRFSAACLRCSGVPAQQGSVALAASSPALAAAP